MNGKRLAWIPALGLALGALSGCSGADATSEPNADVAPTVTVQSGSNTVLAPMSSAGVGSLRPALSGGGANVEGGGETGTLGIGVGGGLGLESGGIGGLGGGSSLESGGIGGLGGGLALDGEGGMTSGSGL